MRLALFLLLVVAVLGILLATQDANLDTWVPLQLPFSDVDVSSPILGWIGGSLGVGFLLGYLVALPGRIGAARRARKVEKQLAQTEPTAVRPAPASPAVPASSTEADEMQRLADEVARRTETVKRDAPPPPPAV